VYSLLSLAALDIPFNTYDTCTICSTKDPSANVKMPHLLYCTVHHRLNHVLSILRSYERTLCQQLQNIGFY
jgi:hypothetical protein